MQSTQCWNSFRLKQLAACLTAALGLGAPLASQAITRNVISCADDLSVGTLRQVIAGASSGDLIEMSALTCSTITLAHGEIPIPLNDLNLEGPSDHGLSITAPQPSGGPYSRILHHTGTGVLGIDHLRISGGKYANASGDAAGGCILSKGSVNLYRSNVSGCTVSVNQSGAFAAFATGAGIQAYGYTRVQFSQVSGNTALAFNNNAAEGGGIETKNFYSYLSTLSGNMAVNTTHPGGTATGRGGGVAAGGNVSITQSTIDSNQADFAGAIYAPDTTGTTVQILASTISGNHANDSVGAISASSPLTITSSTIAFNSSGYSAAVQVDGNTTVDSSIIAKNSTRTGGFTDLNIIGSGHTLSGGFTLIQSGNFGLPGNITSDPQLAPLAYHGALTRTHALNPLSPAVDHGDPTYALVTDQRGSPRNVGAAPDIGAYERQNPDDEIFYGGFD